MYIGKLPDGTVYGIWSVKQPDDEFHQGIEEVPDDHPEAVAALDFMVTALTTAVAKARLG